MTSLRQQSRVMAAVGQPTQNIGSMLDKFQVEWVTLRAWGRVPNPVLPPISNEHRAEAFAKAWQHYWSGAFVPFDDYKRLLDDTRDAIMAANAHWNALKGKGGTSADLRRRLLERDGDDCWICGHNLHDNVTIEHKVALANGGTWAMNNLALAHVECNRALARLPLVAKEAARTAMRATRPYPMTQED